MAEYDCANFRVLTALVGSPPTAHVLMIFNNPKQQIDTSRPNPITGLRVHANLLKSKSNPCTTSKFLLNFRNYVL